MKKIFFIIFFIVCTILNLPASTRDQFDIIRSLVTSNPDSAYVLAHELLDVCESKGELYGLVKAHYVLGYLYKKKVNFSKSVIHYLEAIRYADQTDYDGNLQDRIYTKKNLANIFRLFKSNKLAIQYYQEGIELAASMDGLDQMISLKFDLALTYKQNNEPQKAIDIFLGLLTVADESRKNRILNEMGLIYQKNIGDLGKAKACFLQLVNLPKHQQGWYTAKGLHNLAEIAYSQGNMEDAMALMNKSIDLKNKLQHPDYRSLLLSYQTLGNYQVATHQWTEGLKSYLMAERLAGFVQNSPFLFKLYKSLSNLSYKLRDHANGKRYSDIHAREIDNYLVTQEEIQKIDGKYNMNLITQQYFTQVAEKEKANTRMLYLKFFGGIIGLLIIVIGYNWIQKVRIRRSIERELIKLKIIED